ncbi:helix-turn-helix domain-containing protein [Paraburkholderia sp. J76]|uniref:winged helix-turn-helix transcriptional regulator n=1 Tax=Paraburkholderia sp. J76 TaxID=2805439 RepID=UPI002ABDBDC0|nr:helix-turn-helix domain-containing protein [Paraburkholderia sp. J76]
MDLTDNTDIAVRRQALLNSSITHALYHIGDRWTLSLLFLAFLGTKRFDDFQVKLGIPRQTLSLRLKNLVALEMFETHQYQDNPPRTEYRLGSKGLAMYPCVLMSWRWEKRWGWPRPTFPDRLTHRVCGYEMTPMMVCSHCGVEVSVEDVKPHYCGEAVTTASPGARAPRWGAQALSNKAGGAVSENLIELLNDRWIILLLGAVMLGCHSFDTLQQILGIGSSVLASRLKMLSNTGLLTRSVSQSDARRFVYRLTPRSRDLFSYIVTLGQWSRDNLPDCPTSLRLTHISCGSLLEAKVVCDRCRAPLLPHDVNYRIQTSA